MSDQVATAIVITGLAVSVGLIVFFAIKFQQTLAEKEIDEIELQDKTIADKVNNESLSDLVSDNNKSKGE